MEMNVEQFRPLALCRSWDDLRQALRDRCDELSVARLTVDRVGGLPDGQTSKLLAPVRAQEMGRLSFPAMLAALGLAIIVVEDAESLAKIRHRLVPRSEKNVNADAKMLTRKRRRGTVWKGNSEWGRIMAARRLLAQSRDKRTKIASRAARIRWRKHREKALKRPDLMRQVISAGPAPRAARSRRTRRSTGQDSESRARVRPRSPDDRSFHSGRTA